jgi:hypothetical protein
MGLDELGAAMGVSRDVAWRTLTDALASFALALEAEGLDREVEEALREALVRSSGTLADAQDGPPVSYLGKPEVSRAQVRIMGPTRRVAP